MFSLFAYFLKHRVLSNLNSHKIILAKFGEVQTKVTER